MPTPKRYCLKENLFNLEAGEVFEPIAGGAIINGKVMLARSGGRDNIEIPEALLHFPDWFQELPEEGEIEELDWFKENNKCMPGEEMLIGDTDKVIEEKLNEVIRIVNQLRREKRA